MHANPPFRRFLRSPYRCAKASHPTFFCYFLDEILRIKRIGVSALARAIARGTFQHRKLVCNESRVQITTSSIYGTRYARGKQIQRAGPDRIPQKNGQKMPRRSHPAIFPGRIKICARQLHPRLFSLLLPPPVYFNAARIYPQRGISNFSFRTSGRPTNRPMRRGGRGRGGLAVGPRSRYLRETARPSVFSRGRFDGRPPPEFQRGERTRVPRKISINSADAFRGRNDALKFKRARSALLNYSVARDYTLYIIIVAPESGAKSRLIAAARVANRADRTRMNRSVAVSPSILANINFARRPRAAV